MEQQQESNPTTSSSFAPPKTEFLYKILVIGDPGAGKTSFIRRYVHHYFSPNYRATIGVDFALKALAWDDQTDVRLQLWDIAGQERFSNMTRVYYKDAVGAILLFDVTNVDSFHAVDKWKADLDSKVLQPNGDAIPCVLVGNKSDQPLAEAIGNDANMETFCKEKGFVGWFPASAKENVNVEEAAGCLVQRVMGGGSSSRQVTNGDGGSTRMLAEEEEDLWGSKPKKRDCSC